MVHNLRPQLHKDTVNATPKIRIRNTAKSEEFPELKKLSRQTKKVEEVAYNCGECPKGFTPSEFCLLHRGYTKTQKRCCRTCGVQYSTITALIVHNKTKHGISAEENSSLEKVRCLSYSIHLYRSLKLNQLYYTSQNARNMRTNDCKSQRKGRSQFLNADFVSRFSLRQTFTQCIPLWEMF